ncbi:MAG TPA: DUF2721 domain-containing protein [Anaerolineales bacterium]|nr:DUF2721 domain-containing protein [Anaerolineales bacterium]
MDLEMVARAIQLIIAPAVLLTACCIFTNGLLALYAAIGERLRLTAREKVDLLKETATGAGRHPAAGGSLEGPGLIVRERLADIDLQLPNLLRHHLLVRNSLAGTFIAMAFYILDMFVIAYSVVANRTGLFSAILAIFLMGVAFQLTGVLYSVFDAFMSHKIYAYESRHAMSLEKSNVQHEKFERIP